MTKTSYGQTGFSSAGQRRNKAGSIIDLLKPMRDDPAANFRSTLVKGLTLDHQMQEEELMSIAKDVSDTFLSCVNKGSKYFHLLNVTLKWKALCGSVIGGEIALPSDRFAGLLLVGVLRWFDGMRSYHQFNAPYSANRAGIDIDHVEATTCMAFWKHTSEVQTYWPTDALEVLLERVNNILSENGFGAIDKQRLREAVDRLKIVSCLTTHAGWYGLREEMKYQVPEE